MTQPWNTLQTADHAIRIRSGDIPDTRIALPHTANGLTEVASPCDVVVVGAGLAGCWTARLLAEQGIAVCIVDRHQRAANGASGNPAGIVKPHVTRSPCLAMTFHTVAHRFLIQQLQQLQLIERSGFKASGVLQLVQRLYPDSTTYATHDATNANTRAGLSINSGAIEFADSGWLNPAALCPALLDHHLISSHFGVAVSSLEKLTNSSNTAPLTDWQVKLQQGKSIRTGHVVIACGDAIELLPAAQHLPLIPARGQISRFALTSNSQAPRCVISGKHYVIPDGDSILVGATFTRDCSDSTVLQNDHALNFAGLQTMLPSLHVDPIAVAGYAGIRATTPDRLPVVGPIPDFTAAADSYADLRHGRPNTRYPALPVIDGLSLIGGLGSRGIVTAPLCAHLLTGLLVGTHKPVDNAHALLDTGHWNDWATLLNPARFLIRNLKRGISS